MRTTEEIIALAASFYGVTTDQLMSTRRTDPLVRYRFSVMGALRAEGYKLTGIGLSLNRDHGTIIHGLKQLKSESMGNLWLAHLKFMDAMKAQMELNSGAACQNSLRRLIQDMDRRISELRTMRQNLSAMVIA